MNRIPSSIRQYIAAFRLLLVFTVICGIAYPVVMWGVAQAAFKCQEFVNAKGNPLPQYFQPRPSAATSGDATDYGCDPGFSAAANLSASNPTLVTDVKQLQQQISAFDHVPVSAIPPDAVTSSGSGLDPDISPQNAAIQIDRVAATRHLPVSEVQSLVSKFTQGRNLGILGESRVDVLTLNIALDELPGQAKYVGGALSK
jgi:potassium-transporting ATPase KdpC subunit